MSGGFAGFAGRRARVRGARLVAAVALGLAIGVASAAIAAWAAFRLGGVRVGPWTTNVHIGHAASNPWLRAAVALGGLLALDARETIYFTAFEDDDGRTLSRACAYRVEGTPPSARRWSITAYGADSFLLPNTGHRYSVAGGEDSVEDSLAILAGPGASADLVLGEAPEDESFSLTLRLYEPSRAIARDPARASLPSIRRLACE